MDNSLPGRTTPTWEVELLISGVAVFAMLQLPGWLDDRVFALEAGIAGDWRMLLMVAYFYAKSAAVVLAITFGLHLLLRAQWIALVGIHSVYPQGVQLSKLRMGPIQRAIEEARPDRTVDAIERADNRASVVFAIGVTIASIIVVVCATFCGGLLLAKLLALALGWQVDMANLPIIVFAVVLGPFLLATSLDHWLGHRLRPGGLPYRLLAATTRFYTRAGMGRRNNQVIAILASNNGERRIMAGVVGLLVAAILAVVLMYAAMRNPTVIGSYGLFPDDEGMRLDPAHYDDQRNPARARALPYVQSTVITGPYVQLMVPYRPGRDEPAMRAGCAETAPRLACLQALHGVMLDGKPLDTLAYEIASDPRTGRPALLAMIDVRELVPGRHELRVARPPPGGEPPDKDDPDPGFDRIPFWK
ncbi:MAG: hypothetical protein M3Y70_05455 [Pseudomonadota bacterium]|nr:hypothetical protein [Pseudomonadota bacterium]